MHDQLSLLDLPPEPLPELEIGERLSGKTVTGKWIEGDFQGKSMSGLLIFAEGDRTIGLVIPETAKKIDFKPVEPLVPPNAHVAAFYEAQAALYLRLMGQFMEFRSEEGRVSRKVRAHEIARLHQLRQQTLEKLRELGA